MITAIKNVTALQFEPSKVLTGVDVIIEDDRIIDAAAGAADKYTSEQIGKTIDGTGKLIYPGLVCSHHHYYSGLSRGVMANIGPTPDFVSILKNLWWRLDRALDEEMIYYSGLICSLDAVQAGTTACIDHHASPSFIKGSLATLKKGFERVGLRGMTCYEVTDRNGLDQMREGVEENIAFAALIDSEKKAGGKPYLVEVAVGGHAPCTIPDEGMTMLREAVRETGRGIHLHVGEDAWDTSYSHAFHGKDIVKRLADFGLLDPKTILVHGVHLGDEEVELLNRADGFLVHNARSNMNNNVGYNTRLPKYANGAIGTDGIGSNMFEEFKFAYFKHKDSGGPLWPGDFLKLLWNGNRILERYFGGSFGTLDKGSKADLVISDYNSPSPLVAENIAGHMAFGMTSTDVRTVIVDGKVVYEDREFPFDLKEIYLGAAKAAKRLWEKMDTLSP